MRRHGLTVTGQVQGVGFRPFVYRTATALALTGQVGNTSRGVRIEVQGASEAVDAFCHALRHNLPPLARIATLTEEPLSPVAAETAFVIAESHGEKGQAVLVSPDMGTCEACLKELFDPADRRYLYPFINCTDCGPRLTITRSIPYDRATTSMACFPQCPACLAEYSDPGHRRFHAQPNACPVCGPRLWLAAPDGQTLETDPRQTLDKAVERLAKGQIVGLKGLGGFHLVCDARNVDALRRLRERKGRPHQSLAVMVAHLAAARRMTLLSDAEADALCSARRPIVALERRSEEAGGLPALVAPDLAGVGLMLPYTPLHHVLLHLFTQAVQRDDAALVMTSGNPRGEPLCLGNREALQRLGAVADCFVLHDRDILVRADDSVVRVTAEGERRFVRRARGFVPEPLPLPPEAARVPDVLAVGAELKNTICLTRGNDAFVSQHLGDMTGLAVQGFFVEVINHYTSLLEVEPRLVVRDAHPDYQTAVWAAAFAADKGLALLELQHHLAHLYSVLAEHGHDGPALGLALDGAGYGPDGTIWGGELLLVHPRRAGLPPEVRGAEQGQPVAGGIRLGRLGLLPLPGGDVAVREPWRLACALLAEKGPWPAQAMPWLAGEGGPAIPRPLHDAVMELTRRGTVPLTSSCGRLFDAVAAVLGLCSAVSYEGQAAIRLETCQHGVRDDAPLCAGIRDIRTQEGAQLLELDSRGLFRQVLEQRLDGTPVPVVARRFHAGLARGLARMARMAADRTGLDTVGLSGGVLHNAALSRDLASALQDYGLKPLFHRHLPPGDGGLAFGQAAFGKFWLQNRADTGIVGE